MAKAALELIRVEWYEGHQFKKTPFTVESWSELDDFLMAVYDERVAEVEKSGDHISDGGYNKVKVHIEWVNGDYLTDRIDVGGAPGDYKPSERPIGLYLKGDGVGYTARGTMYGSSFQYETKEGDPRGIITETTRDNVAWTDAESKDAAGVEEYHKEQEEKLWIAYVAVVEPGSGEIDQIPLDPAPLVEAIKELKLIGDYVYEDSSKTKIMKVR